MLTKSIWFKRSSHFPKSMDNVKASILNFNWMYIHFALFAGNTATFIKYLVEGGTSSQSEPSEPHKTKLHEKLQMFYTKWYSSNVMCLVVLGKGK